MLVFRQIYGIDMLLYETVKYYVYSICLNVGTHEKFLKEESNIVKQKYSQIST